MIADNGVFEFIVNAECLTNKHFSFNATNAICVSKNKAYELRKKYIEMWKEDYELVEDKHDPWEPGRKYYFTNGTEKWILTLYIVHRKLDQLWVEEERRKYYE